MPFVAALAVAVVLPAGASAAPYGSRTLSLGAHGADVKKLQRYLGAAGHRVARDGEFGPRTQRALRATERSSSWARTGPRPPASSAHPARGQGLRHRRRRLREPAAAREGGSRRQGHGHRGRLRGPAGLRARRGQGRDRGRQRDRHDAVQVGRRPRALGRHRLRLLRLGLLRPPRRRPARRALVSGDFARWGSPGPGRWITIYANRDHVYMVVAGMRFDTSARSRTGSRWTMEERPSDGFSVTHPRALYGVW